MNWKKKKNFLSLKRNASIIGREVSKHATSVFIPLLFYYRACNLFEILFPPSSSSFFDRSQVHIFLSVFDLLLCRENNDAALY